jgi:aspartyl-tRNA(Asn)/glutamyl-tRNA(Gln) amidotransferase subunit B
MEYELVVGMEIHAQLKTRTKLFCRCPNRFGDAPNENTCPVCLGHPGTLPVLNQSAVERTIKAGLAFNCEINKLSRFARKNYYYPDLPKGYQISQYEQPICTGGWLEVKNGRGEPRKVRLRRIHIEEDAGKLLHEGIREGTCVDLNRAGTPLMELVTEPDFRSVDEVHDFLGQLRQILRYLDVCDGNMEEGSLRCEPNVSVRPAGSTELGVKIELKNLSSFKAARKGIEYEFARQIQALKTGEPLRQETRGWDEDKEQSYLMRVKEDAHDYRYFPDPDLPPVILHNGEIAVLKAGLAELPQAKKARLSREFGLSDADVDVICSEAPVALFFEKVAGLCGDGKTAANWVMGEVLRALKSGGSIAEFPIREERLAALIKLVQAGRISHSIAKKVFEEMLQSPDSPETIVEQKGLGMVSDDGAIGQAVDETLQENPAQVEQLLSGKDKVMAFLVGQIMRKMKGKADPVALNRILKEKLDSRKKP